MTQSAHFEDASVIHRLLWLIAISYFACSPCTFAGDPPPAISADRIKAHIVYLASDRLEGRGPGTRGEELSTDYISNEFKKTGLKPVGQRDTYFQPVPLVRVATSPKSTLQAVHGKDTIDFAPGEDFSGTSQTQTELEDFDAEAVFVGHGITAPEFDWDDYKGVDVKGKVVVLFTNEPPSEDPKFFGGKALTYYGRWTFKFEEAARRGAIACFIIHTNQTAGYPFSVVRPLDGAQLKRVGDQPALAFAGWLSHAAGDKLLALSGHNVDEALKAADTKGFKPFSLGVNLKGHIATRLEKIVSNNVVGLVEGSDPKLKDEAVMFTAHWDHLGVGRAVVGDSIYNGAADNATGCAILMELARAWATQSPRPKRSAIFLAVTAEEKGLLGSKYYAQNPIVPLEKTALDINFDMVLPLGVPESVVVTGADRTTAWLTVKAAATKHHLEIEEDQRAHLGIFYRSDHFSMARAGVPAFSVGTGMKIKGKPEDFARKAIQEFNDTRYHSPQDEVQPDWDYSGLAVLSTFAFDVAREVANADHLPSWNVGDEFHPARKKSGSKLPGLRLDLLRRVKVDQEARTAWIAFMKVHGKQGTVNAADLNADRKAEFDKLSGAVKKADEENTARLSEIVEKHGWPTKALVGEDGAHAAWLLVQHADANVKFQRKCLDLMAKSPKDEVSQKDLAYLTDRVLLAEGKKQIYGTQFTSSGGKWEPRPLEDPANVDKRRAEVGLPPLAEYVKLLESQYGSGSKK